jgi:glycosyltransferase involved in cell wall biosynthesis
VAKISTIVPVYNVKPYINQCIQSLVSQTCKDIEIILIDDGSTDGSSQICDLWKAKDSRIKVIHTSNHGVSHARNVGLDVASGEYISFVDSDDWIEADTYESMLQSIEKEDFDLCIGLYKKDYDNFSKIEFQAYKPCILSKDDVILQTFTWLLPQKKIMSWEIWDKLFKTSKINKLRFDEAIHMGEDMLFYWYFLKNVDKVIYCPLFKYHYRMRSTSAVHQGASLKTITGFFVRKEILKSSESEKRIIYDTVKKLYIVDGLRYARYMITLSPVKYKEVIKEFQRFIRKNLLEALAIRDISFRAKIGIIYFLLPYTLCKALTVFTKKKD